MSRDSQGVKMITWLTYCICYLPVGETSRRRLYGVNAAEGRRDPDRAALNHKTTFSFLRKADARGVVTYVCADTD